MVSFPLFIGFYACEVVQDFFHQQYLYSLWWIYPSSQDRHVGLVEILKLRAGWQVPSEDGIHEAPDSVEQKTSKMWLE